MNIIIELILKIFLGIFEEDADRRKKGRPTPAPGPRPRQGPNGEQQDPQDLLAEFFRELQGLDAPPQVRGPAPVSQRRKPVPSHHRQRQDHETLEEHILKQQRHLAELEHRADALAEHAEEHLGVDIVHKERKRRRKEVKLPGETPLQQMIYAGVILGPCKARQKQSRLL